MRHVDGAAEHHQVELAGLAGVDNEVRDFVLVLRVGSAVDYYIFVVLVGIHEHVGFERGYALLDDGGDFLYLGGILAGENLDGVKVFYQAFTLMSSDKSPPTEPAILSIVLLM